MYSGRFLNLGITIIGLTLTPCDKRQKDKTSVLKSKKKSNLSPPFLSDPSLALFDMPNLNRFDILSISIFCKIALSISISISIFSNMTISISISISIFFKSVDISTIDMSYRYIEQGYLWFAFTWSSHSHYLQLSLPPFLLRKRV